MTSQASSTAGRRFVLALDQGTTSSRAILFDERGAPVAVEQEEFPQHTRAASAAEADQAIVEHDPEDIWNSQIGCGQRVIAKAGIGIDAVAAIGITNQRETTILWEQSRVSAPICVRHKARGDEAAVRAATGLLLDPYFSATKIVHLLETVPGLRARCEAGEILFGTVDSFLIWRLTGGSVHATDVTNASRTLLYDIHRREWSPELCSLFGVPRAILPEVRPSSGNFGEVDPRWLGGRVPIAGCAGDQQAAAFGQGCTAEGTAKNTYGTGAFLLFSTGSRPVESRSGLLTTPGCAVGGEQPYCLEGAVFIAGALVGWLRDGLGIIAQARDIEPLARSVPDAGGVMFVPALTGLGTPDWDPGARGLVIGLSRATSRGHIARAALEGIALSVADVVDCMERDAALRLRSLRVDGGASANGLLLQTQADVLGIPVERPAVLETTALGAALLAGMATGVYADQRAVDEARRIAARFEPQFDEAARRRLRSRWREAVERAKDWARP
jgi:glycerol kinase